MLSLLVHVVERDNPLIKLEEVDFVSASYVLLFTLLLFIHHLDAGGGKVVGHGQLRVPIEADVLSRILILDSVAGKTAPSSFVATINAAACAVGTSSLAGLEASYIVLCVPGEASAGTSVCLRRACA